MSLRIWTVLALCMIAQNVQADPVMDRINKTNTLRCGYVPYHPGVMKDPNTGKLSGYDIDIMNEIGRRMHVKIEWPYETNWPTFVTDMQTKKFDALCVGYWANPTQAKFTLSTDPVSYEPMYLVTRVDDKRFDEDVYKINDPKVTLAVLEGDVPDSVTDELFPKAKRIKLSQQTAFSQVFQEVATKHADVTLGSNSDIRGYSNNNPGKIKAVTAQPIRYFSKSIQMPADATVLQSALNLTIREMQLDGTMERILTKYAESPYDYYLVEWPKKPVVVK